MHHVVNGVMMSTLTVHCRCREETTKTSRPHKLFSPLSPPYLPLLSLPSLSSLTSSSLSLPSLLFPFSFLYLSSISLVSLLSCFISHVTSQCQILTSSLKLCPSYYMYMS